MKKINLKLLLAILFSGIFILGCTQPPKTPTSVGASPYGVIGDFWSDRTVNFPVQDGNYTGNTTTINGIYGTIKKLIIVNGGVLNSTAVILDDSNNIITLLNATTGATTRNRTVAYENYGQLTINYTGYSGSVRIITKHT